MRKTLLVSLSVAPYEILKIVHAAHIQVQRQNTETQNLLKCLRRNGFLAYRPNFEEKCLKKFEGSMADDMPQGNHRMPSDWIEQRFNWFKDGIPQPACWEECGPAVNGLEDMIDVTQHGDEDCTVEMACLGHKKIKEPQLKFSGDVDISAELPADVPPSVQLRDGVAQRRGNAIDKFLTAQTKAPASLKKKENRAKIKLAYRTLLPKWREEVRDSGLSRKQMLEALIPSAGDKNKSKKIVEAGEQAANDNAIKAIGLVT